MAYNTLTLHSAVVQPRSNSTPSIITGYDETKSALQLLKNVKQSDLSRTLNRIEEYSNKTMMRGGRQNLPQATSLDASRFNQDFIKGDFLCPAQY